MATFKAAAVDGAKERKVVEVDWETIDADRIAAIRAHCETFDSAEEPLPMREARDALRDALISRHVASETAIAAVDAFMSGHSPKLADGTTFHPPDVED